jgi:hypothetical protein
MHSHSHTDAEKKEVADNKAKKMLHHWTLLDGELVIDTYTKGGKKEMVYLVYDILLCNRIRTVDLPLPDRLKIIESTCLKPRTDVSDANYSCIIFYFIVFIV